MPTMPQLTYQRYGDPRKPCLVLVHGFLGSADDWQPLLNYLVEDYDCICLDLPGHGDSQAINLESFMAESDDSQGFTVCVQLILNTLATLKIKQYWLLGYSLGGRIGLHLRQQSMIEQSQMPKETPVLQGLLLEGSHSGLTSEAEKQQRAAQDQLWAQRLQTLPMREFLSLWYQQAVFADLAEHEKAALIDYRQHNQGQVLAPWFVATSLAKQADLAHLATEEFPIYFFAGSKDHKFSALAKQWQQHKPIQIIAIDGAGHNIHRHQPQAMAIEIKQIIAE